VPRGGGGGETLDDEGQQLRGLRRVGAALGELVAHLSEPLADPTLDRRCAGVGLVAGSGYSARTMRNGQPRNDAGPVVSTRVRIRSAVGISVPEVRDRWRPTVTAFHAREALRRLSQIDRYSAAPPTTNALFATKFAHDNTPSGTPEQATM
jgi:hypothetical protein